MTNLVIAEHDNKKLSSATRNTISAALKIGGEVHVLVAGEGCAPVAAEAAKVAGVAKVKCVDNAAYGHQLAENIAALVVSIAGEYSHILSPGSTFGKDFTPRIAALLDVAQLSDVMAVI